MSHLKKCIATSKRHIDQQQKRVLSTQETYMHKNIKTNLVIAKILGKEDFEVSNSEQTEKLPVISYRGYTIFLSFIIMIATQ